MSKSVLVVDDEFDQRALMRDILEIHGYRVATASNGREALQILAGGELPGVIFLDITMPVMSGREFLAELCSGRYPQLEKIPVVVISAVAHHAGLEKYSCAAIVMKPFDISAFLSYAKQFTADEPLP